MNIKGVNIKQLRALGVDSNAITLLDLAGITDNQEREDVGILTRDLINSPIWNKSIAIYIFAGSTAQSHAINLKIPGTFNLSFFGGWTHSATGALPNGINGYARTAIIPSSDMIANNMAFSVYSRTAGTSTGVQFGSITSTPTQQLQMRVHGDGSLRVLFDTYNTTTGRIRIGATQTSKAYNVFTRISPTASEVFQDNVSQASIVTGGGTVPTHELYMSGRNNVGTADAFSSTELAFAHVGEGLTTAEVAIITAIVEAHQVRRNRQN